MGRKLLLIADFLTTALQKSLHTVGGKSQILKIHSTLPGNSLKAAVQKSNWWGRIRHEAAIRFKINSIS